jgi:hypothetical protein
VAAQTNSRSVSFPALMVVDRSVRRAGPVGTAVGLGLLSVPLVAWTLVQVPAASKLANVGWVQGPIDWHPMTLIQAILVAVVAVLPAAGAGGWAASRVRPSDRRFRVLVAMTIPWALAVVLLPVMAWALSVPLRAGIVCTSGCEAMLRSDQPWSGAIAYLEMALSGIVVFPAVALAAAAAWIAGELRWRTGMIVAVVFAHGAQHWVGIVWAEGSLPYAALAVGVVIWAHYFVPGWSAEPPNTRRALRASRIRFPGQARER